MGILLGFAPFIAFAILDWVMGPTQGLIAGALVSLALLLREWLSLKRVPKVLEIGTTILFGGLALYAVSGAPTWSIVGVRLRVDVGLLLIVLVSIAIRRPFTLQYAKEQVPREMWDTARFRRINYVISAVWARRVYGVGERRSHHAESSVSAVSRWRVNHYCRAGGSNKIYWLVSGTSSVPKAPDRRVACVGPVSQLPRRSQ